MAIAPLQLPGPLVVPQLDWSGLDKVGDAFMRRNQIERENKAFEDVVAGVGGPETPAQPGAPGAVPPGTAQPTAPRGLRNNNFGNIKDGPFAKTMPGYVGADEGGFARFESPAHGAAAMDSLLDIYGRKGAKSINDVISRWAPASDGNNVGEYAKFVANGGDPNAPLDLSNPESRAAIAKRMTMFENGIGGFSGDKPVLLADRAAAGAPREGDQTYLAQRQQAAPLDAASLERTIPETARKRMIALYRVGTPQAQAAAYAMLSQYVGKQEPIKMSEGDILVDRNDPSKVVARAPGKQISGRPGGFVIQDGKVVYQAPADATKQADRKLADLATERRAQVQSMGLDPTQPEVQKYILTGQLDQKPGAGEKIEDQVREREAQAVRMGMDPKDDRVKAYVLTGKMPGEDKMPITPTDKKAILDADEHVLAHTATLSNLKELKDLSAKAWGFKGSTGASTVLAPFNQGAADTAQLNNAATANAVAQLKSIFGGNPTEGERAILLDISGSSSLPHSERLKIYERAERAVERRQAFAERQASELRDRSYWKPGGGTTAPGFSGGVRTLSKEEVQGARTNPEAVRQEARDAIASGRDRDGVLRRLQQLKISTEGL
jgi:hypothetical protein